MLNDLHDWTLISISATWKVGIVEFIFIDQLSHHRKVCAYDFTELNVPRLQSWGRSVSVNSMEIAAAPHNQVKGRLEMQTGDVIEVVAREIALLTD